MRIYLTDLIDSNGDLAEVVRASDYFALVAVCRKAMLEATGEDGVDGETIDAMSRLIDSPSTSAGEPSGG
jgi:hypothetical protein